jgi:uncharacterized membrane protein YdbT with pleckstrin-like domain
MMLRGAMPGVALLILVIFLSFFKDQIIVSTGTNLNIINEVMPSIGSNLPSLIPTLIPVLFFLAIIFGGIGIIINTLRYNYFIFSLEEFGLKLKRGILDIEEITIPYRQMQNVDISRSLLYRFLGLSRLVVFSAGNEQPGEPDHTDTVFDSIDFEIAEEIRELLGRRIGVQVVEHESEADSEERAAESQPAIDL